MIVNQLDGSVSLLCNINQIVINTEDIGTRRISMNFPPELFMNVVGPGMLLHYHYIRMYHWIGNEYW